MDPKSVNGLNLYCYCNNDPVNYADSSGHMPEWAKWLIGGLAITGLVAATILTFGAAGTAAGVIGAAMLTGGVVSGAINAIDQLHDGGTFNWTELAIATLSGTAYGAVVGATGGAWTWGAFGGKVLIAGATAALNSWNENKTGKEIALSAAKGMALSVAIQLGAKYGVQYAGKYISPIISRIFPRDPNKWLTMGDVASVVWSIPAVKTGAIKFGAGVASSIFNDIF